MPFDAVMILGGGVREGGALPAWVVSRFDRALELAGDALLLPLSAGTPYRPPPLDGRGFPIFESRAGANYLISRGVAPRRIVIEASSYDTLGNAYFSRVIHAVPRRLARLLIVTSEFHMPRAEAVFRWVYGLDGPGPAATLAFASAPDSGIDAKALQARVEKEEKSMAQFQGLCARVHSLAALHDYLFAEHGVYSATPSAPNIPIDIDLY